MHMLRGRACSCSASASAENRDSSNVNVPKATRDAASRAASAMIIKPATVSDVIHPLGELHASLQRHLVSL